MPKATLHKEIDSIAADYDDVVIDGPPRSAEIARSIIMASDVIVLPIQPSPLDVWEAAKTLDLVREAQVFRTDIHCCLVINRRIANTAIERGEIYLCFYPQILRTRRLLMNAKSDGNHGVF